MLNKHYVIEIVVKSGSDIQYAIIVVKGSERGGQEEESGPAAAIYPASALALSALQGPMPSHAKPQVQACMPAPAALRI